MRDTIIDFVQIVNYHNYVRSYSRSIINLRIIWRVTSFPCFYHKVDDDNGKQNIDHSRNDKQSNKYYTASVTVIITITCLACWLHNH